MLRGRLLLREAQQSNSTTKPVAAAPSTRPGLTPVYSGLSLTKPVQRQQDPAITQKQKAPQTAQPVIQDKGSILYEEDEDDGVPYDELLINEPLSQTHITSVTLGNDKNSSMISSINNSISMQKELNNDSYNIKINNDYKHSNLNYQQQQQQQSNNGHNNNKNNNNNKDIKPQLDFCLDDLDF